MNLCEKGMQTSSTKDDSTNAATTGTQSRAKEKRSRKGESALKKATNVVTVQQISVENNAEPSARVVISSTKASTVSYGASTW